MELGVIGVGAEGGLDDGVFLDFVDVGAYFFVMEVEGLVVFSVLKYGFKGL